MTQSELTDYAARYGLQVDHTGNCWRITGKGVDIVAADLRFVRREQLRPSLDRLRTAQRELTSK